MIKRDKEDHYRTRKRSIQEDMIIINKRCLTLENKLRAGGVENRGRG